MFLTPLLLNAPSAVIYWNLKHGHWFELLRTRVLRASRSRGPEIKGQERGYCRKFSTDLLNFGSPDVTFRND